MLRLLLAILFILLQNTISQNSTTCPKCPENGIWSDWITNDTCATSCGACSNITRTRSCISDSMGCPCVGDTSQNYPCNTQACIVAQVNTQSTTCCIGNATLINNLYHCVPPPTPAKMSCCPPGGYWADWSTFVKTSGKTRWSRTQTCMSENTDCPCTGSTVDVVYECPCLAPTSLPANDMTCQNQADRRMSTYKNGANFVLLRPQVKVRPTLCQAYVIYEQSNLFGNFAYNNSKYQLTGLIGNVNETGYCSVSGVPILQGSMSVDVTPSGMIDRVTFTCNLQTLRYGNDAVFTGLYKVSQFTNQ